MHDLTYRNMRADDFTALSAIAQDWSIVRQLGGWNWPYDPEQVRSRCKPYEGGDGFVWAICRDDRMIGTIGVTGNDLGYMLGPAWRGRGIATRAATDAISHAFSTTDAPLLTGSTWFDNPVSGHVLRKLGFEHWQTRYIRSRARGGPTLTHNMRLTRARWDRLRTVAQ